jgi:hypothetical protein
MHRIFFDANSRHESGSFRLWFEDSKNDLAKIPGGPKEGEKVTIYTPDELEMEAVLEWNPRWKYWTARGIAETVKYLDGT